MIGSRTGDGSHGRSTVNLSEREEWLMNITSKFLRRDPAEVKPWDETCGQIRPVIEEKDGYAAAEIHHVEIDGARLHYHEPHGRVSSITSSTASVR